MSAYSDWKCGAITEEEYKSYCNWEDLKDRAYEESLHDWQEEEEDDD